MALASMPSTVEVVDLRHLKSSDLTELFLDEEQAWKEQLHWDYRPSSEMLRRHIDAKNLAGYAALAGGTVAGYCFFLYETRKGLLGDLFVRPEFETAGAAGEESITILLLQSALETLLNTPHLARIEAQLISSGGESVRGLFEDRKFEIFPRLFMYRAFMDGARFPSPARQPGQPEGCEVRPWQNNFDEMAGLIVDAYTNHVDSRLNDQYSDRKGARKFLQNIVTFPGCGSFRGEFSLLAVESSTGRLLGALLISEVATRVAHITQVCVRRGQQGKGIGRWLMEKSLQQLQEAGFRGVSLTVTALNENAVGLYRQLGFTTLKEFDAYARNLR